MKRAISSPTGFSPNEKRQTNVELEEQEEGTQQSEMEEASHRRGPGSTTGSVTSSTRREMERQFSFANEKQNGPWRDVITVDILTVNGEDYKGTVKPREARDAVYQIALGLERENLHGLDMEFRGHPVISFRLKTQINVDLWFKSDIFGYTRGTGENEVRVEGKIRGVRLSSGQETFRKSDNKKVKIKNCKWALKEEEIVEWMEGFGKVVVPLAEEVLDLGECVDEDDEDEDDLGTGNYWITMELERPIPQFIPMCGKKIEIYYRGMRQVCVNCYMPGHKKRDCVVEKREWMDYVSGFIEANPDFREEMYGRWAKIAKGYKRKQNKRDAVESVSEGADALEPVVELVELGKDKTPPPDHDDGQPVDDKQKNPNPVDRETRSKSGYRRLENLDAEVAKGPNPDDGLVGSYRNTLAYKKNIARSCTAVASGEKTTQGNDQDEQPPLGQGRSTGDPPGKAGRRKKN